MKTCKRKVVVYLDMIPMDTNDSTPSGCAHLCMGGYIPAVYEGNLRNRVEIEVVVPCMNEVVDLGVVKAEVEGVQP
jgi:hypothetical protein